ncbi:hypothetical protein GCM10023351_34700 [Microbacterium gilvum]|uniref:Uncharacterized protein n=1 Tax=Microbacterium gilvum TaxID=1336204 RepID=A0ABP9AU09_9MICO
MFASGRRQTARKTGAERAWDRVVSLGLFRGQDESCVPPSARIHPSMLRAIVAPYAHDHRRLAGVEASERAELSVNLQSPNGSPQLDMVGAGHRAGPRHSIRIPREIVSCF